ncbi:MAG: hypothetical protein HY340_02580 [Candidatus Kerfeldbacteria bacterium]|nr:hypothetical protein [Candidatus Kerfeldbacteria bacterium]
MTHQPSNKWRLFQRIYWIAIALVIIVLFVYRSMQPDPDGLEVHSILGLFWDVAFAIIVYFVIDWFHSDKKTNRHSTQSNVERKHK